MRDTGVKSVVFILAFAGLLLGATCPAGAKTALADPLLVMKKTFLMANEDLRIAFTDRVEAGVFESNALNGEADGRVISGNEVLRVGRSQTLIDDLGSITAIPFIGQFFTL